MFEGYGSALSPPCLDLSMAAAVQSGPPPGLALSAHGSPSIAAMVSRPLPLSVPSSLMHHHHGTGGMDGTGNGPPNPEVLLALLSRNKNLEGKIFILFKSKRNFFFLFSHPAPGHAHNLCTIKVLLIVRCF